ncbi:hypothetical protein [Pontibacter oryzae]|uniref:Uncharacterized protein n=1 Tax=Pontibacter oryzae TaxID=2304593 RepID=A0A399SJ96_9BACT|nr:hypothetical protein [Pontibacter oryzae]RIJ42553.1 hypothetical protein D1627_01450 [Pontibacter oryzae]
MIEKQSGVRLLEGTWVDVDESEMVILYLINLYGDDEELKLRDLKTNKEFIIKDFSCSECAKEQIGGLRNCVEIDTVNSDVIVLKIENEFEKIVRKYKR